MKVRIVLLAVLVLTLSLVLGASSLASGESQCQSWRAVFGDKDDCEQGFFAIETSEGGYAIVGTTGGWPDIWLIKTGAQGDKEWSRSYDHGFHNVPHCTQQTRDGGYIIVGSRSILFAHGYYADILLIKTDVDGNEEWHREFGDQERYEYWSRDEKGYFVQQTLDGGYIIVGVASSRKITGKDYDTKDIYLIKTDAYGDEQWHKTFGGDKDDIGYCVQQTTDGGYILVGFTDSYGAGKRDVWLIKTDANGNKEWHKTFGGDKDDIGYCVQQTTDGGYILVGSTDSYSIRWGLVWLIKTDGQGNKQWDRTFSWIRGYYGEGYSVQQTTDGGYIVAGRVAIADLRDQACLLKVDAFGQEEWSKVIGGPKDDEFRSVRETLDGGYIMAGTTGSFGEGYLGNIWLVKYCPEE